MGPLLCANMKQVMGDAGVELFQPREADPYPHRMHGDVGDDAPQNLGSPVHSWGTTEDMFSGI